MTKLRSIPTVSAQKLGRSIALEGVHPVPAPRFPLVWRGLLAMMVITSVLSLAPRALAQLVQRGDRGPNVVLLQNLLIQEGFNLSPFGADGIFGKVTENAVLQYQRECGLPVTGIAGPQTLNSLTSGACRGVPIQPPIGAPVQPPIGVPIQPPIGLPVQPTTGPYVVVVPGSSLDLLSRVQGVAPFARVQPDRRGDFVNAGAFQSRGAAEDLSRRLRGVGLPARVAYFR